MVTLVVGATAYRVVAPTAGVYSLNPMAFEE